MHLNISRCLVPMSKLTSFADHLTSIQIDIFNSSFLKFSMAGKHNILIRDVSMEISPTANSSKLSVVNSTMHMLNCRFSGNNLKTRAQILVAAFSNITMENIRVENIRNMHKHYLVGVEHTHLRKHQVSFSGNGFDIMSVTVLFNQNSHAHMSDCMFEDSPAVQVDSGCSSAIISNCTFQNNRGDSFGAVSSSVNFSHSTFENNTGATLAVNITQINCVHSRKTRCQLRQLRIQA